MLNLDDPRTEIIFTASSYLDKLITGCERYSTQDFENRELTFLDMLICCEEFLAFCKTNYPERIGSIFKITDSLIKKIKDLMKINIAIEEGNCTICNGNLDISEYNDKKDYRCGTCSSEIYKLIYFLRMETDIFKI